MGEFLKNIDFSRQVIVDVKNNNKIPGVPKQMFVYMLNYLLVNMHFLGHPVCLWSNNPSRKAVLWLS